MVAHSSNGRLVEWYNGGLQNIKWHELNPLRKIYNSNGLVKTYSFDEFVDLYHKAVEKQQGSCAICKLKVATLCVDHDHLTGKFRGLLCPLCNRGLGSFKDSVIFLKTAVDYLGV